jgi:3-hydroxyacyl-CoA dehydrogenase/3a,7a,12a-trihydroxy-5b-cholest-24-enoyl-CoA hydratase
LPAGLATRIAKEPGIAAEVGAVLGFKLTDPEGAWTVDLTGKGSVSEGEPKDAKTVITLSDEALGEIAKGGDVRDLYQHGKLRIDGEIRLAHKLGFLKGL